MMPIKARKETSKVVVNFSLSFLQFCSQFHFDCSISTSSQYTNISKYVQTMNEKSSTKAIITVEWNEVICMHNLKLWWFMMYEMVVIMCSLSHRSGSANWFEEFYVCSWKHPEICLCYWRIPNLWYKFLPSLLLLLLLLM